MCGLGRGRQLGYSALHKHGSLRELMPEAGHPILLSSLALRVGAAHFAGRNGSLCKNLARTISRAPFGLPTQLSRARSFFREKTRRH